jgi:molybdopterin converting factor small subunit
MRITVRLHAVLRRHLPAGSEGDAVILEVGEGTTAQQVIEQLGIPAKHAGMLVCGDEFLEGTSALQDGQELNVFPPMAGGGR